MTKLSQHPCGDEVAEGDSHHLMELTSDLFVVLQRVVRGMRRQHEPDFGPEMALSKRHGTALYCLLGGPQTVGELATHLELGLATVSGVVAELDRAGIVERHQDPADRRRTIVTITPECRPAIETWMQEAVDPLVRALKQLSPEECQVFLRAMTLLDEELAADARI